MPYRAIAGALAFLALSTACKLPGFDSSSSTSSPSTEVPAPSVSGIPVLPGGSGTCTGDMSTGASGSWVFPAAQKGAQRFEMLVSGHMTEADIPMIATGASEIHFELYSDGATPESGTLLGSSSVTNPASGLQTEVFSITAAALTQNEFYYLVFWTDGAGFTASADPDYGFPPFQGQMFALKTIWDNGGAGNSWETLGNYDMGVKLYFTNLSSCSL
jgi:hypothetical protein